MNLKNTQTEKNLQKALAGESIARNKYTYFAEVARNNGNEAIAVAFEQMARNEMMHAKFWFESLYGMPKNTNLCLIKAAQGEFDEWFTMYPEFAKTAREEGFEELAVQFERVAKIEHSHENRFLMLMAELSKQNKQAAAAPAKPAAPAEPVAPVEPAAPAEPAVPVKEAPKQKKQGYRCQFCGMISDKHLDVCDLCGAIGAFEFVEYFE